MTKISILGCGWLGLPLAKMMLSSGFFVKGSTTSEIKLSILKNDGVEPFLISLEIDKIIGDVKGFLNESQTLIIDIPPKLKRNCEEEFVGKIKTLIPFIEKSNIKNTLFISSTSVYGDENTDITEETILKPDTEAGKQLVAAEQLLQSNLKFTTTILRFGGLIGEDRHPIHFLAGRENLKNPHAAINLIHQNDCIGIIQKIIELNAWNQTFNAVAPFHPSREEYYTQKALELNLALPKFDHSLSSVEKTISSDKIERILNYRFSKI